MSDTSPAPPPPEWAPHEAVWIGFPSDPELWLGDLKPAEREVAAFAEAVHAGGKGEKVWLVAAHDGAAETARAAVPRSPRSSSSRSATSGCATPGRSSSAAARTAARRASASTAGAANTISTATRTSASGSPSAPACPFAKADWILEGGAIDGDGSGTVVTTEQCLLNPNRNTLTREEIEQRLLRRPRLRARGLARLGPDERPYRRPCRQSRALRRAGPGRDPDRGQGRPQRGGLSSDAARRLRSTHGSTSSPCPRPAGSPTRTATSSRRAT